MKNTYQYQLIVPIDSRHQLRTLAFFLILSNCSIEQPAQANAENVSPIFSISQSSWLRINLVWISTCPTGINKRTSNRVKCKQHQNTKNNKLILVPQNMHKYWFFDNKYTPLHLRPIRLPHKHKTIPSSQDSIQHFHGFSECLSLFYHWHFPEPGIDAEWNDFGSPAETD